MRRWREQTHVHPYQQSFRERVNGSAGSWTDRSDSIGRGSAHIVDRITQGTDQLRDSTGRFSALRTQGDSGHSADAGGGVGQRSG